MERSGGMLPRKIFENVDALMAILVLFKQFSAKFCLNLLTLIPSVLPNIMHFVRTFSIIYACLWRKAYCYRRDSKL